MTPAALLTRRSGALVAIEPNLACATGEACQHCDVLDDCANGEYGDPQSIALDTPDTRREA